jgi:hypothetical protein
MTDSRKITYLLAPFQKVNITFCHSREALLFRAKWGVQPRMRESRFLSSFAAARLITSPRA